MRQGAKANAQRVLAGFAVHDEAAERAALDKAQDVRRGEIERFTEDRAALTDKLKAKGVTPLAVLPTAAWRRLCRDTGLFRLVPDQTGKVWVSRKPFETLFKGLSFQGVDTWAKENWPAMLGHLFPECVEPASHRLQATLELPPPPPEVVDILLKAKSFPLQIVAEPAAIGIKEPISTLAANSQQLAAAEVLAKQPFWQRQGYASLQEWVEKEPIITTDYNTATAVLAQFGPFVFEQQVIDAVCASDHLLADLKSPANPLAYAAEAPYLNTSTALWEDHYDGLQRQLERANNVAMRGIVDERMLRAFEMMRLLERSPIVTKTKDRPSS